MSEQTTTAIVTPLNRPESITPETWEAYNKNQQKQALDAIAANKALDDLNGRLAEIALNANDDATKGELIAKFAAEIAKDKTARRFALTFLEGSPTVIPLSKASQTKFVDALTVFGNDPLLENFDGFLPLAMPEPQPPKVKANELTTYLNNALAEGHRVSYSDTIKALTKEEIADLMTLSTALMSFAFTNLETLFPDHPMPKAAMKFVEVMVSVKPPETTTFSMTDEAIRAQAGISAKGTLITMRNALMTWQAATGCGLIDIDKSDAGKRGGDGIRYTLHIVDLLSEKAVSFIENGVTIAQAMTAITAIRTTGKQAAALPEAITETATAIMSETVFEVASLPPVTETVTAQVQAANEAKAERDAAKAAEKAKIETARHEALSEHLETIRAYRSKQATGAEIDADEFADFVNAQLAVIRHDETNLLTSDEAAGKLETVLKRIEADTFNAFALIERLGKDGEPHRKYLKALAGNIANAADLNF